MCNYIKRNGHQCKLPAKPYCHIHKKDAYLKDEIKNLNKTLLKKAEEIKQQKENEEVLYLELRETKFLLAELEDEKDQLVSEVESMKHDFEAFQTIKRFERLKMNLSKHIDVGDVSAMYIFLKANKNKSLLKDLFGKEYDNYNSAYETMRWKRNKVAHYHY